jgi:hypothetical protein
MLSTHGFKQWGFFLCHIYCNLVPWFIRSHPKDRHPRPTVGFEPGAQGYQIFSLPL